MPLLPKARAERDGATGLAAPPYHALATGEVELVLGTGEHGLPDEEAARRLATLGPNRLTEPPPPNPLVRFAEQFRNLLILVLLAAAAVTVMLGHWIDAAVILGVVLANAVFGFVQEGRAEKAIGAIRRMLALKASVIRGGSRRTVDAERLVVGDLVLLEAGDRVPADIRLTRSRNLQTDEAALTGESVRRVAALRPPSEPGKPTGIVGNSCGIYLQ